MPEQTPSQVGCILMHQLSGAKRCIEGDRKGDILHSPPLLAFDPFALYEGDFPATRYR